jgi:NADH pyrophosphatase NudC (nudix superfamily)
LELLKAYKHCIYCGGSVSISRNKITCQHCHKARFVNPSPAVTALLLRNDEILLVKRAVDPSKDKWDLPGGFIDLNENYENAIQREMQEELGIKIKSLTYFNSVIERYLYQEVNEYVLVVNFLAVSESEEFKPDDDIADAKYFNLNEALQLELAFPTVEKVIKDLIDFKANS